MLILGWGRSHSIFGMFDHITTTCGWPEIFVSSYYCVPCFNIMAHVITTHPNCHILTTGENWQLSSITNDCFSKVDRDVCTCNCNSAEKSLWTGIRNLEKEKEMRKTAAMDHSAYMEQNRPELKTTTDHWYMRQSARICIQRASPILTESSCDPLLFVFESLKSRTLLAFWPIGGSVAPWNTSCHRAAACV